MEEKKEYKEKELEKVSGGEEKWVISPVEPTICPVCGGELIKHPDDILINGFTVYACKNNIKDMDHWVVWQKQ